MLISHKYKFIFIKTTKTAGTSIEIELNKLMCESDVVTRIKPSHKDHNPRNYIYRGIKLFPHMLLSDLKKIIPKDMFNNYYKFCVEREPVDKCLSDYFMYKNSPYHSLKNNFMWDEYLASGKFPVDTKKYTDDKNNLIVDKIIKYENLNKEFEELSKKLGFKLSGINVKEKSGYREKQSVNKAQKDLIYDAFSSSNKFTGYLNK
tara:strand:+ start:19304 stop:19915 length:612 start_codon:yes stop_codon:yes gene_type:complete